VEREMMRNMSSSVGEVQYIVDGDIGDNIESLEKLVRQRNISFMILVVPRRVSPSVSKGALAKLPKVEGKP
jgi:hypothetical protein